MLDELGLIPTLQRLLTQFLEETGSSTDKRKGRLRLLGMRERVEMIGGKASW
jgi:signal transduction histidine kinase